MMDNVRIDMTGKVALVTGGGYGMGRATSLRFAHCGAAVVVADIDKGTGPQTVEMIRREGGRPSLYMSTSVTKTACET